MQLKGSDFVINNKPIEDQNFESTNERNKIHVLIQNLGCYVNEYLVGKKGKKHRSAAGIYLLKVDDRNTKARCEICTKSTIDVNGIVPVSLLLTLNM